MPLQSSPWIFHSDFTIYITMYTALGLIFSHSIKTIIQINMLEPDICYNWGLFIIMIYRWCPLIEQMHSTLKLTEALQVPQKDGYTRSPFVAQCTRRLERKMSFSSRSCNLPSIPHLLLKYLDWALMCCVFTCSQ